MLLGKEKTTQDYIIELLARGESDISTLHNFILQSKQITRPAIYDQLKKLISDGIVIKNKTRYVLSNEWKNKLCSFFRNNQYPSLQEGERLSYSFQSLQQMDAYWKHLFPIYDKGKVPVFMYNAHCFWMHIPGRKLSEEFHYQSYAKEKRLAYFLIGNEERLDFDFKKKYQNKYFKINCVKTKSIDDTHHITVIGDIIFNSKIPKTLSKKINALYKNKNLSLEEQVLALQKLTQNKMKVRLEIEHNKKKAEQLKKRIGKDFYIPYK